MSTLNLFFNREKISNFSTLTPRKQAENLNVQHLAKVKPSKKNYFFVSFFFVYQKPKHDIFSWKLVGKLFLIFSAWKLIQVSKYFRFRSDKKKSRVNVNIHNLQETRTVAYS